MDIVDEQFELVHAIGIYDLEVDSSTATPEECAEQVKAYISQHKPVAVRRIVDLRWA